MKHLYQKFLSIKNKYSAELYRSYQSVFENRDIEIISDDFSEGRWISKQELYRLYSNDVTKLIKAVQREQFEKDNLVMNFKIGVRQEYDRQDSLKKEDYFLA